VPADMMSMAIPRALAQDVRSGNLFSKRGTAVLDAPEPNRAPMEARFGGGTRSAGSTLPLRRDAAYNDFEDGYGNGGASGQDGDEDGEPGAGARRRRGRSGLGGAAAGGWIRLPQSLWGRIAAGCAVAALAGAGIVGALAVRSFLLHDEHFTVPDSESIQIAGNSHLTRAQLLSVFGEDVERNVFHIPLAERRAELESLPWVAHATVMRLLPNRVRVGIVERTPVAFVRQASEIALVDANGVLLDIPGPEDGDGTGAVRQDAVGYSFPVLTGISAADPLSMRAARMRIYMGFMAALDATGEHLSQHVSEVDLSAPEDVRAIVADGIQSGAGHGADILLHFGDDKFLERYKRYQEHLAEWRTLYPKLTSVDLRYERQVVLQMQKDAVGAEDGSLPAQSAVGVDASGLRPTHNDKTAKNGAPERAGADVHVAQTGPAVTGPAAASPANHAVLHPLTTAFDVVPKPASGRAPAAKPALPAARPAATAAPQQGAPR